MSPELSTGEAHPDHHRWTPQRSCREMGHLRQGRRLLSWRSRQHQRCRRRNKWTDITCAAYKLHLCVTTSMGIHEVRNNPVVKCIAAAARLVRHFTHSTLQQPLRCQSLIATWTSSRLVNAVKAQRCPGGKSTCRCTPIVHIALASIWPFWRPQCSQNDCFQLAVGSSPSRKRICLLMMPTASCSSTRSSICSVLRRLLNGLLTCVLGLFYLPGTVFERLTLLSLGRLLSETASSFDFGDLKTSSVGFCTGQAGCPPYFYFRFQFSPVACTRYVHSQLA